MADSRIAELSLAAAAAGLARGDFTALEATEACLARLESVGPALNAIAGLDAESARAAAREADAARAAGRVRGPLHGVPMAHKDMYYRAGRESACGSVIRRGFVPDHTATALRRLDAAGALDIARLNMVEFAYGVTGHNAHTGHPRNPWQPDHITGGSSSGVGAAIAAGCAFGGLGSDTGGSIRIPAACCGLVGLKPTYGRVSRHGAMPLSHSLDHVGPMTRTVADAALMLQALAGPDAADPTTAAEPVPDYTAGLERGVAGLRVGVCNAYFLDPATPEIAAGIEAAAGVFRSLGAELVEVSLPRIETLNALTAMVIAVEAASYHGAWLRERPEDYNPQTRERLLMGVFVPAPQYVDALRLRGDILKEVLATTFETADVLLAPALPRAVPTIEESDLAANPGFLDMVSVFAHCTRPFNFLGLPALSLPAGRTANGLPAAIQLAGRPFAEAAVLRVARAYERETGCTDARPDLAGVEG